MELISNVVNYDTLKDLYIQILEDLSDILKRSYGPYGSNSLIQKGEAFPEYTKDGHTILSNVRYHNKIEETIRSNILSITEYITKGTDGVGDGTTSAVLMSCEILKGIVNYMNKNKEDGIIIPPGHLDRLIKECVNNIKDEIKSYGRPFEIRDSFDISMISTNGDENVSNQIYQLYKELGKDVYISLDAAHLTDDVVSIYDGLVLETGIMEECYINDAERKVSRLNHPRIYAFKDPIDTPEMFGMFEAIIKHNIYDGLIDKEGKTEIVPTVIITPKISRDASPLMEHITKVMGQMNGAYVSKRPPLLIITNLGEVDFDQYADITQMCGCKPIMKYINPQTQKLAQEKGTAPTMENVFEFYGEADVVEADSFKTTFINPKNMFTKDEDGKLVKSEDYNGLVAFIENEIEKAYANKANMQEVWHLKKRLNSLKATYVEWHVGGLSATDRDQRMTAIDDAVRNCRSAARDGVGYGANFEGFRASMNLMNATGDDKRRNIYKIIFEAYTSLLKELYREYYLAKDVNVDKFGIDDWKDFCDNGKPINIVSGRYEVLSSIMSDQMILDGIAKIITIMATSNQYICPDPLDTTVYRAAESIRKKKEEEA